MSLASPCKKKFRPLFPDAAPLMVRSPGRVNLIGEHTDYNNGFVLPAAIDKAIYLAIGPARRQRDPSRFAGPGTTVLPVPSICPEPSPEHWPNYLLGVVQQLQQARAYDHSRWIQLCFRRRYPAGFGYVLFRRTGVCDGLCPQRTFGLGLDKLTMVRLSQRAENVFVGVQCGIMDQFASMFGRRDQVIRLDCQSLDYVYFPFNLEGIRIVLLDTGVKHSLASSEYNTRRQQCEAGVRLVRAHYPEVSSLRDVTPGECSTHYVAPVDELVYRRCRFIVGENARLLAATEDLQNGDLAAFGQKMFADP